MRRCTLHFQLAGAAAACLMLCPVQAQPPPPFDLAQLQSRSEAGDPAAQYQLGRAFLRGEGVPRNLPEAYRLLKSASGAGNADAKGAYGFMIAKGMTVPADEAAGLELIRQSAAAGVIPSKLNLGIMTLKGQGTARDQVAGLKLITEAATLGNVDAQVRLAEVYHFGDDGVAKSPENAAIWAMKAAEAGNAWAQNLTGAMKEHALGMSLDLPGALVFYRKAAEQGEAKAQSNLGRLLQSGLTGKRDAVQAYYWLKAAADQAEVTARNLLEETLAGFTEDEIKQAKTLAEKSPPPMNTRKRAGSKASWLPHPTPE